MRELYRRDGTAVSVLHDTNVAPYDDARDVISRFQRQSSSSRDTRPRCEQPARIMEPQSLRGPTQPVHGYLANDRVSVRPDSDRSLPAFRETFDFNSPPARSNSLDSHTSTQPGSPLRLQNQVPPALTIDDRVQSYYQTNTGNYSRPSSNGDIPVDTHASPFGDANRSTYGSPNGNNPRDNSRHCTGRSRNFHGSHPCDCNYDRGYGVPHESNHEGSRREERHSSFHPPVQDKRHSSRLEHIVAYYPDRETLSSYHASDRRHTEAKERNTSPIHGLAHSRADMPGIGSKYNETNKVDRAYGSNDTRDRSFRRRLSYRRPSSSCKTSSNVSSASSSPTEAPKPPKPLPKDPGNPKLKRYACKYRDVFGCDAMFSTSGHASRHAKRHTKEKGVMCTYEGCGRFFTRSDNMKQHLQTHSRVKKRVTGLRRGSSRKQQVSRGDGEDGEANDQDDAQDDAQDNVANGRQQDMPDDARHDNGQHDYGYSPRRDSFASQADYPRDRVSANAQDWSASTPRSGSIHWDIPVAASMSPTGNSSARSSPQPSDIRSRTNSVASSAPLDALANVAGEALR